MNKYTNNNSKGCVLEVDFEYPTELCKLYNDYPLASDKIEIKKMLPSCQLMIAYFYNIPIGNPRKLVPNFFDKGMYVFHFEDLQLYLRPGLKLKQCIVYKNLIHKKIEAEKKETR